MTEVNNHRQFSPEEYVVSDDIEAQLHHIINQLPDRQREIFRLTRDKGLTHKEIAKELQISQNTVKNHLVKALKTLRDNYELISSNVIIIAVLSMLYLLKIYPPSLL